MPRKAERPQRARHILIFDDDWDFLTRHFGPASATRYGVSPAIRQIVHHAVIGLRTKNELLADAREGTGHQASVGTVEVMKHV